MQELLALIQAEGLAAGQRLPSIRQLSTRFGVRPHLVRDALVQAQSLGYVKILPRSRAVIQSTTPRGDRGTGPVAEFDGALGDAEPHLFDLLEARQLLEFQLVRQAAKRRRLEDLLPVREALNAMHAVHDPRRWPQFVEHDIRFHLAIARVAGNPVLTGMLRPVLAALRPFLCRLPVTDESREQTQAAHAQMYRALVAGDGETAHAQMVGHLQFAYDNLLGEVQSLPGA